MYNDQQIYSVDYECRVLDINFAFNIGSLYTKYPGDIRPVTFVLGTIGLASKKLYRDRKVVYSLYPRN